MREAEKAPTNRSVPEMLHLNLPRQPCSKLLTNDPHTTVSVAEAVFKRIPGLGRFLLECSCWQHTDQPDWGGNELKLLPHKFVIWRRTLWYGVSLGVEVPRSTGGTICPAVCGYEPINTEMCWPSSGAVTHQGAVVQESGGEVAAEAERQDVPLPGAEGHFAFWKTKKERGGVGPARLERTSIRQQLFPVKSRKRSWALSVWNGDPYRSTMTHRGRELWTLGAPDPPWWDENGVTSAFHLQSQRHRIN